MWRNNVRGDVSEKVARLLDTIQARLASLEAAVDRLEQRQAGGGVNMLNVRTALQAGGATPLSVEGLLGHLSQPQFTLSGWTTPIGVASRSGFDTSTATVGQVAQHLKALIDDLHTGGML